MPIALAIQNLKKKLLNPEEEQIDEAKLSMIASSMEKRRKMRNYPEQLSVDLEGIDPRFRKDSLNDTFSVSRRKRDSLPSISLTSRPKVLKVFGSERSSLNSFDNSQEIRPVTKEIDFLTMSME